MIRASDKKTTRIVIGRAGENKSSTIEFDLTDWISEYGQGTAYIMLQRPCEETPYTKSLTLSGNNALWNVEGTDLTNSGYGSAQLVYAVDGVIKRSHIWQTVIQKSLVIVSVATICSNTLLVGDSIIIQED